LFEVLFVECQEAGVRHLPWSYRLKTRPANRGRRRSNGHGIHRLPSRNGLVLK